MEQTLGKRIMQNRKRLGLTQDALAEQLGVTAQAVSKWENDQSCPDITMLPKLSEIFGISTDELLGREVPKTVHQAEIVDEDDDGDGQKDGWEFKWNSGRRNGVIFALFVLLVGALTLLAKIYQWEADFWSILWPCALLVFGLGGLFPRFSAFRLGCCIFGGYSLVANLDIWKLSIAKELIFPIMILLFGVGLLIDVLRKPKKPRFSVTHNGHNVASGSEKTKSSFTTGDDTFECSLSFGENSRRIELPRLAGGGISCSFGELTVDLSGCEEITDGCRIEANCSFGELTLLVPRKFRVEPDSSTAFASLDIQGQPDDSCEGMIRLDANVSFGEIRIKYI